MIPGLDMALGVVIGAEGHGFLEGCGFAGRTLEYAW